MKRSSGRITYFNVKKYGLLDLSVFILPMVLNACLPFMVCEAPWCLKALQLDMARINQVITLNGLTGSFWTKFHFSEHTFLWFGTGFHNGALRSQWAALISLSNFVVALPRTQLFDIFLLTFKKSSVKYAFVVVDFRRQHDTWMHVKLNALYVNAISRKASSCIL